MTVAEAGQITLAARKLHLSQPSVTSSVQALERHLGVTLLVRLPRGVELTHAGTQFLAKALAVLAAADDAVQTARRSSWGDGGTLRVGVHGPAWPDVEATLDEFRRARPDVTVSHRELTLITQEHALLDGQVDVVFNVGVVDDGRFSIRRLRQDPLVLAVPNTHRLTERANITVEDLLDETFVSLHPAAPKWCGQRFTLAVDRGGRGHLTKDEASTSAEVVAICAQTDSLFTAPASFARTATVTGLTWRVVEGLQPITLDIVAATTNRNPLIPELMKIATKTIRLMEASAPRQD